MVGVRFKISNTLYVVELVLFQASNRQLMPLLKILDFSKIPEKVEKEQGASDSELSEQVNLTFSKI